MPCMSLLPTNFGQFQRTGLESLSNSPLTTAIIQNIESTQSHILTKKLFFRN